MRTNRRLRACLAGLRGGLPAETVSLLGHRLRILPGTVRRRPDYDDAWWVALCRHARQVFDIGANVGYTALLALLAGPPDRLLLVDPNAEALARAAYNLALNGLIAPCSFRCAFADARSEEQVRFYTLGAGAAGSTFAGHARSAAAHDAWSWVPATTLDALVHTGKWLPDLVKIDVEGAEARVLTGAVQLASSRQTRFLVEMHSPPELPMALNAQKVLDWCRHTGYRAWYCAEAEPLRSSGRIAHRGKCHLLLQPNSWAYPQALEDIPQGASLPQ